MFRPATPEEGARLDQLIADQLDTYQLSFVSGRKQCLIFALYFCLATGTKPPLWVANACCDGILTWMAAQAPTLDAAFGLPRPPHGKTLTAKRDRIELAPLVVVEVARRHQATGKSVTAIIAAMALQLKLSDRTLWSYYTDPSVQWLHQAFMLPKRTAS
jgi:hypothetical protein